MIRFDLFGKVVGELADDLAGKILDHAGTPAVLRYRPGQLQVGVNLHRRSGIRRFQMKADIRVRAAAALCVGALRLHGGGMHGIVDVFKRRRALERERYRPEPDRDLSLKGFVVDNFGQLSPWHAGRDPFDIHQGLPCLIGRQGNLETVVEIHRWVLLLFCGLVGGAIQRLPDTVGRCWHV